MGKLIKLSAFIISACMFLPSLAFGNGSLATSALYSTNYLVCGMDDVAENTDVLSLININTVENKLTYIQIPRDTYCNGDVYNHKINHVYSTAKASGMSEKDSMKRLTDFVESAFLIRINGYVAVNRTALVDFIDDIGGIYVALDKDITIQDSDRELRQFKKGQNFLNSHDVLLLARHRKGYPRGDLDRLEVQKRVFLGLVKTLGTVSGRALLSTAHKLGSNVLTNLSFLDIVKIISGREGLINSSITMYTLVGEAVKGDGGISYYALNKEANSKLLREVFGDKNIEFDPNQRFLKKDDAKFKNIYFKTDL